MDFVIHVMPLQIIIMGKLLGGPRIHNRDTDLDVTMCCVQFEKKFKLSIVVCKVAEYISNLFPSSCSLLSQKIGLGQTQYQEGHKYFIHGIKKQINDIQKTTLDRTNTIHYVEVLCVTEATYSSLGVEE